MNKFLAATAVVFAFSVASPAMAATQAECDAQWAKLDAKKAGYVMNADAKQHVDMMSKAGRKTAAADLQ